MATAAIKATGSQVIFCDSQEINRREAFMGVVLQKYIRLFREVWPQDYPPLNHIEFCLPSYILSLYTDTQEIAYFVLEEQTASCLETQCKEILCKILQGTLI